VDGVVALGQAAYAEALDRDRALFLHSVQSDATYVPEVIARASGNHVWTADGRKLLDFRSQAFFANIGHGDQRVIDAISDQLSRSGGIVNYATPAKLALGDRLRSVLPDSYERFYFGLSGSDAVELALRSARLLSGRQNVIAFQTEYHGATMGAASVSGARETRVGGGELVPGTILVPAPYHYRSPFGPGSPEEVEERAIAFLRQTIDEVGADTIAAVLGEPFISAGPGVIPSHGYWRQVEALCREKGILLIADEVITGFGRSGKLFARDVYDYEPDIICMAKGLTGGYAPLSAVAFREPVGSELGGRFFPFILTHAGHPVGCAAALACLDVIEADDLVARSAEMGRHLHGAMLELAERHPSIGDVRSLGLFTNVEFVQDRPTKTCFPDDVSPGVELERRLFDAGVLVRGTPHVLKLGPPLTVEPNEINHVAELLDGQLDQLDRRCAR
jgi:taurine---2-oxoglutarate transaminase